MLKERILALMILSVFLVSGSSGQDINKRTPLVDLKEIKEITFFHPYSQIEVVGKGMERIHFDSASSISAGYNLELLMEKKYLFDIVDFHPMLDSLQLESYSLELKSLAEKMSQHVPFEDLQVGPTIYALLDQTETRYSLMIYHGGFIRKKGNMTGEVFKSIALGVATFGNAMYIPTSHESNVFLLVIDRNLGHAVFAKKFETLEANPLKKKMLAFQYKYLFKDFEKGTTKSK